MDHWISQYGIIGIGIIMFMEMVGIPFPAETTLVFSGIAWANGTLDPFYLIPIAIIGHVLGSSVGYGVGRSVGRLVILKYGRYVWITPEKLAIAEQKFQKFQSAVIISAKFIAVVRILIPFIAGINRMPFWRFTIINFIGTSLWVFTFVFSGKFLGKLVLQFEDELKEYLWPVIGIVALIIIVILLIKKIKRPESPQI